MSGHLSPGGGFQGGVLMVAVVVLIYLGHGYENTVNAFRPSFLRRFEGFAVTLEMVGTGYRAEAQENGRKLNASQERLPLRVSPKGNSRRMKIAEKISSSSRRSAMISTSTSVKKTYKIIPRTSARICVRTYCALPLTFVALEMTTMP